MKPDFSLYDLALVKDDKLITSSRGRGLKPLLILLGDQIGQQTDCLLFDKIVGLAGARLIAMSGLVTRVQAKCASSRAMAHLQAQGIDIQSEIVVDQINNREGTDSCPMEKIALANKPNNQFVLSILEALGLNPADYRLVFKEIAR